jgi:peptidoglycan hydrolase-like protein with peptidoglycan-binding domain
MRIRSSTWGMPAILLLICAGLGHAAPPNGAATDTTAPTAAKSTAATTKKTSAVTKKPSTTPGHSTASRKAAVVARGQMVPTASRVSEIQAALAKDGAYQGDPNGRWDASTVDAMRHFQTEHNLNPSGKIDALTLQKLGLGSQVSGMGAPLPIAIPQASAADNNEQSERP